MSSANIARYLSAMAERQPATVALKVPHGRERAGAISYLSLTFAELQEEVDAWIAKLAGANLQPGQRVLVMVRPGLPLIAAAFALFKFGAVPVIIDPGMGLKSFLSCVRQSRPQALLGIPVAQVLSRLFRPSFRTVRARIAASGRATHRLTSADKRPPPAPTRECAAEDLAAILFTSGSTGAPKGVCYEHGMFEAQVRLIRATYEIQPGEIDLPMLPIFALFNPALGMTTVVPEIDPSRPATVDPRKIVQAVQLEKVTNSFGSPTLWNKIADYCIEKNITLPSLRRVLCAGAPVPFWSCGDKSRQFLPNGQLHSPYGATESLPISSISAQEVFSLRGIDTTQQRPLGETESPGQPSFPPRFRGACVGRPVPEVRVQVIELHDHAIASVGEAHLKPTGEIGEIIVNGPVVTKTYDRLPLATAEAKLLGIL